MPGIVGRRATVQVPGDPVAFAAQATTNQGDNKTYQITNSIMRIWDPTVAITVFIGGVSQPPNGADPYTINRLNGKVIFTNANAGRAAVTVSGSYLPMATAGGSRSFAFSITAGVVDDSDFDQLNAANGFRAKLQGMLDFSGNIGKRWRTTPYFASKLLAGSTIVVRFYADRALAAELIAWARLDTRALQAALEGSVDVDVSFVGVADAENRVISLP